MFLSNIRRSIAAYVSQPTLLSSMRSRTVIILATTLLAAGGIGSGLLLGCYTNPATGKEQLNLIPESQEIAMGREAHKQIEATMGFYDDRELQAYVTRIGESMAKTSERPNLPWTFRIVDDPVVNAFALPGGFIYVTRGMLAYAENEAELAGVIGHEIGHVTAKHSVNQMSKQQLAQIGLAAGSILEPDIQKYGQLIGTGLGLLFLKFSRDDEREADDLGLRYMVRDGYDPEMMDDIFQVFERMQQQSGSALPSWLSTHPSPEDRIQRIRKEVSELQGNFADAVVNREGYLEMIDGLVFGKNPREGYFRESHFYHPSLEFQMVFPEGWQTVNQRALVVAQSPQQNAILQLTISQASTLDGAANDFAGLESVTMAQPAPTTINGQAALSGAFEAATDQGTLRGNATFVRYDGNIYELIGYATSGSWATYDRPVHDAVYSFAPLTDPSILAVQPRRIETKPAPRTMTLRQFYDQYPSTISFEEFSLINQGFQDSQVTAGNRVKRVIGEKI